MLELHTIAGISTGSCLCSSKGPDLRHLNTQRSAPPQIQAVKTIPTAHLLTPGSSVALCRLCSSPGLLGVLASGSGCGHGIRPLPRRGIWTRHAQHLGNAPILLHRGLAVLVAELCLRAGGKSCMVCTRESSVLSDWVRSSRSSITAMCGYHCNLALCAADFLKVAVRQAVQTFHGMP